MEWAVLALMGWSLLVAHIMEQMDFQTTPLQEQCLMPSVTQFLSIMESSLALIPMRVVEVL
jgi:hypothetical protein